MGEVQKAAEETSKTTEAAKDAVNAAVDTTIADDSGADQTTKDAAGVLDATANGTFEGGPAYPIRFRVQTPHKGMCPHHRILPRDHTVDHESDP